MATMATLQPLLGSFSTTRASCSSEASSSVASLSSSSRKLSNLSASSRKLSNLSASSKKSRSQGRGGVAVVVCSSSGDVSVSSGEAESPAAQVGGGNWVPVIPVNALPKGERRLVRQDGETVLLLWYKNDVYAIENQSPAEGAYSEGLVNARLTPDGCIVCPSTESTYDLKTGKVKDWMPTNPVLRVLTPSLRDLQTYSVKIESESIYINVAGRTGESAEIVFGGTTQAGKTATNVDVDEVRMVVDDNEKGFGFTRKNEIINGRAAMIGFFMIVVQELVSGKGFLKGIGFLDFLYKFVFNGYSP